MAREVYSFAVTVPAGTLSTAPFTPKLTLPSRRVEALEILVPPGPRGELGFALGASGAPVIPRGSNQWIITDDERIVWPLESAIDSGDWQFFGYNTGTYPHTVYVRFLAQLNSDSSSQQPAPFSVVGWTDSSQPQAEVAVTAPAAGATAAAAASQAPTLANIGYGTG